MKCFRIFFLTPWNLAKVSLFHNDGETLGLNYNKYNNNNFNCFYIAYMLYICEVYKTYLVVWFFQKCCFNHYFGRLLFQIKSKYKTVGIMDPKDPLYLDPKDAKNVGSPMNIVHSLFLQAKPNLAQWELTAKSHVYQSPYPQ